MPYPRDGFATMAGRSVRGLVRVTRLGAGTTLPGRIAGRISPRMIDRRAAALADGVVLVSGTNGKTTTASMIHAILELAGRPSLTNRSGANLSGGVTAAFLDPPRGARAAVLEVDEAVLPDMVARLRPRALVLTNVFRDQLDRFGEPERVTAFLRDAALRLPPGSALLANADDPPLWHAVRDLRPTGFGVVAPPVRSSAAGGGFDAEPAACPSCGAKLAYARRTFAHLGAAWCLPCGWRAGSPRHLAHIVALGGLCGTVFEIDERVVTLAIGGVHNVYNAAAALAASSALGIRGGTAVAALEGFRARFGRSEELKVDGRRLWLSLIKNPAGAGAVIRTVASDRSVGAVVVSVNDREADGRDVSWIWDAEFDRLAAMGVPIVPAGLRADEVALRLKYAGAVPVHPERDPLAAIAAAGDRCHGGGTVAVLATYTAMLAARRAILGDRAARVEDVPA